MLRFRLDWSNPPEKVYSKINLYFNTFLLQRNWVSYKLRVMKPSLREARRVVLSMLIKKWTSKEKQVILPWLLYHGYPSTFRGLALVNHELDVWYLALPAKTACLGPHFSNKCTFGAALPSCGWRETAMGKCSRMAVWIILCRFRARNAGRRAGGFSEMC